MENVPEDIGPMASMDEVKARVKQLADEARVANEHSYKAYLFDFSRGIEQYVAGTNDQGARGYIFLFACEYDYHMASEIVKLPDNLPPTLASAQDHLETEQLDDGETQDAEPAPALKMGR